MNYNIHKYFHLSLEERFLSILKQNDNVMFLNKMIIFYLKL